NLSNIDIPENAKSILQLGQRFNLPNNVTNKEKITIEFIKRIENNLIKLDERTKNSIRIEYTIYNRGINFLNVKLLIEDGKIIFDNYKKPTNSLFLSHPKFHENNIISLINMLVNRLKQLIEQKHRVVEQEYEITDEQIEIQALLEAKARERERAMLMEQPPPDYSSGEAEPEALPVPSAMIHDHQHPGKRQGVNAVSYTCPCATSRSATWDVRGNRNKSP
ncbi:hypothetical protein ALC56_13792, partial [Trachymyrmex septentrionalis]